MKTLALPRTVVASAILVSNLLHCGPAQAGGCPAPSFAAARTFDVGAEAKPFSVATGDFNGDGKLDLAVANYGCPACSPPVSGSVSVLLGNGDGTFQSGIKLAAGPNPQSVAVTDFNGDGKPDLAVANYGSTNVIVLLGNGNATFQTAVSYGVGGTPAPPFAAAGVLAISDLNGDGKVDLAVANSSGVSVLLGNGDGTFQAAVSYGPAAGSVAVADFNGDSKPDLAVTSSGGVSVLLGNGNGTFQAAVNYAAGVSASSVVAGDFNGDGKADLAVATTAVPSSSDNISVLLGNGEGTFQPAVHYVVGSFPYAVTAGDFNGDGKLDLAAATDVGISFLSGNGDGTFQTVINYGAGNHPNHVTAGDFNNDGKPDLAVADAGFGTVCVLLAQGDGTLRAAVNFDAGISPVSAAVADFNGDGKPDLAVADYSSGKITVLMGNGDGTFQSAVNYNVGTSPRWVASGDFNGDGGPDLAVADEGSANVWVLLVNSDGTFRTAVSYGTGKISESVTAGDSNGDGKLDLIVATASTNVSVLLGNGDGTFKSAVQYATGRLPASVAVSDFNGDEKPDLAVANQGVANAPGTNISVLLGNGDGTFQSAVNYDAGLGPSSVAVGDFNGDGKPDLAVANAGIVTNFTYYTNGSVSVLLGNGDGTFQPGVNYGGGLSPFSLVVSDFNGDGRPDIAVTS